MSKNKAHCIDEKWPGHPDCVHCAIRGTVLFSVLNEAELGEALQDIDNQWYEAGHELYAQGNKGEAIYTIRAGCVKMVHTLDDGNRRIVRMHYRGDAIGLQSVVGQPNRNSAIVLQSRYLPHPGQRHSHPQTTQFANLRAVDAALASQPG